MNIKHFRNKSSTDDCFFFFKIFICVFYCVFVIDTQKQESTVGGGTNRHCFYGLRPDSQYKISVYTKVQEIEGPGVSITEKTRKSIVFSPDP